MKTLIVAPENDNHTAPLKWALQQAGFGVACWAGLRWTEKRQASISLSSGNRVQLGEHVLEPGDVVWVRRPEPPRLNPQAAPEDQKFAVAEYRRFFHSVMYLLETLAVLHQQIFGLAVHQQQIGLAPACQRLWHECAWDVDDKLP